MKYLQLLFKLIIPTVISAILFFAVSFLTWLKKITAPHYDMPTFDNQLNVGFRFSYYHQFCMDDCSLRGGWDVTALLSDCVIFWSVTTIIYFWVRSRYFLEEHKK